MAEMRTGEGPPGQATIEERSTQDRGRARRSDDPNASAFNFRDRHEEDEGIPQLLRRLTDQGTHLAQQQAALINAEVRASVNDLKEAVAAMAGAAVVGIAGLGVLLMGLSFLLGEVMELWLATLIVAAVTLAGAYAMFLGGKKKLSSTSMSMDRTRRTLERAPNAISGNSTEGQRHDR